MTIKSELRNLLLMADLLNQIKNHRKRIRSTKHGHISQCFDCQMIFLSLIY